MSEQNLKKFLHLSDVPEEVSLSKDSKEYSKSFE
jgi:glutaredoxin-related protein